jgi:acyl carrier protein
MTKDRFLRMMESTLQLDEGALAGPEALEGFDAWDSLAVMMTLALFDKELGLKVPAARVYECRTVDDLAALAGDRVAG